MNLKWGLTVIGIIAVVLFAMLFFQGGSAPEEYSPGVCSTVEPSGISEENKSQDESPEQNESLPEQNETNLSNPCGEKGQPCCESECKEGLECINDTCSLVLVMFHNDAGPMCLEQLAFLEEIREEHPYLVVEEYYTFEEGTYDLLSEMKMGFNQSEGVSTTFGYLPTTFIGGRAFSGFNEHVKDSLKELAEEK
ncbi:hypothetical protein K8R43_02565 [archaeon]|nr:hypothetical protein [archaeon]